MEIEDANMEIEEEPAAEEEKVEETEPTTEAAAPVLPAPPTAEQVVVKSVAQRSSFFLSFVPLLPILLTNSFCGGRPYDPKAKKTAAAQAAGKEEMVQSPITGEMIPVSKLQEHLRISLLDPKWREQKAR